MITATMVPLTASTRMERLSSMVIPFSTTLLWRKKIIQGAMVVPTMAIIRVTYSESLTIWGTTVACKALPQSGWDMTAATI